MTTRTRWTLTCLCLGALALPASAAGAVEVAPPSTDAGAYSAAAAAKDPGCWSYNQIAFRGEAVAPGIEKYRVRHAGQLGCEVRVKIRCYAALFRNTTKVSEIGAVHRNRCQMESFFGASKLYAAGTPFRENYRYKITLLNEGQRWAGTSDYCPKRTNHRRTLICRDSHSTVAPRREVDEHAG